MKFAIITLIMKKAFLCIIIILLAFFLLHNFLPKKEIANYPSSGTDIIAFGDSLVQGVGSSAGNDFVSLLSRKIGRPIVNLGKSGDTTADGLMRLHELDPYKPKVVLVLLGGNDYLKKIPIDQTQINLIKLIKAIQERGAVVILLGVRGGLINDNFERMYQGLSSKFKTVYVQDVLRGIIFNKNYMSDIIHPNNAGYVLIAEKVYPALERVLK